MNKPSKIVVVIAIIVIIIGGTFCYWQNTKTSSPSPITQETADWKTYTSMGVSIDYPNDGTYTVDKQGIDPSIEGFTITQEHPGNRIHIYKTATDETVAQDNFSTKVINGQTYKEFFRNGEGMGYGYVIKKDGQFYTFESTSGPQNDVFELMMTTVKFE